MYTILIQETEKRVKFLASPFYCRIFVYISKGKMEDCLLGGMYMEKWKKNYLKGLLSEYPHLERYIKEKERELSCHRRNNEGPLLITISSDRRLRSLERKHRIIREALLESSPEVREIIEELYMKPCKNSSLTKVADQVYLSTRQVTRLRNHFFENLLEKLEL